MGTFVSIRVVPQKCEAFVPVKTETKAFFVAFVPKHSKRLRANFMERTPLENGGGKVNKNENSTQTLFDRGADAQAMV